MMHLRFFLLAFALCAGSVLASGTMLFAEVGQQAETEEVIGTGIIHRDNVAKARDEAISQGLWDIVEKGVEAVVSPTAIVTHFQLLSDRVYSRPEKFIHDYKVLTESKSGRHYRVVVRATLMMETLEKTLKEIGVLVPEKVMPDMLFLLMEQNVGVVGYVHSWDQDPVTKFPLTTEQTLEKILTQKGFPIIRPGKPLRTMTVGKAAVDDTGLSDEAALALGRLVGAEVIVVGKAVARVRGEIFATDSNTIEATFIARVLRGEDGGVLGDFKATKAAVDANQMVAGAEALKAAATEVAVALQKAIVAKWDRDVDRMVLVEMAVQGIDVYGDFVRFRRVLRNEVSGIKNVYLKAIKAGEAKIDIELQGTTQKLSEELMKKHFEGFGINILEIGAKKIRLELIPTSQPALSPNVNQEEAPARW